MNKNKSYKKLLFLCLNLADGRKTEERSCLTMEDNKQTTHGTDTANVPTNEDKNAGNKTFSQVDMDNLAGKIRGEEICNILL